jgi:hypothetical protein
MLAAVHLYKTFGWLPHKRLDPNTGAEWSYVLNLGDV